MTLQFKATVPLNISSILNNFKSFIKKLYQKEWTQNIKKNYQNNYLRAERDQKVQQLLKIKVKENIDF